MPKFIQPIAEGLNKEGKFLRICFSSGSLGDLVPVRIRELGMIRLGVIGHSQTSSSGLASRVRGLPRVRSGQAKIDYAIKNRHSNSVLPNSVHAIADRVLESVGNWT